MIKVKNLAFLKKTLFVKHIRRNLYSQLFRLNHLAANFKPENVFASDTVLFSGNKAKVYEFC